MKIGEIRDGIAVTISSASPNQHILIVGTSGTGKSTRISEILADCLERQETVLVLDMNGCDFCENTGDKNVIFALEDGIELSLLDDSLMQEDSVSFLSYIVDNFSAIGKLGVRQMGALREAVEYAIKYREEYDGDMEAIAEGLRLQDSIIAKGVYTKLWNLLKCPVFKHRAKQLETGKVNVLSLKGLNPTMQRQVSELILMSVWRECRLQGGNSGGLRIVLDEFQNLSLSRNSVLMEMLREARKYNVQLILATQSIASFSHELLSAINQTAVQLYFRQAASDVKKISGFIDPQQVAHWTLVLKRLAIGESVATGNFLVDGKEIQNPLIIKSAYRKH